MAIQAQFVILDQQDTGEALLRRHRVWQPESLPATAGDDDCDCALPGATGQLFRLTTSTAGQMTLTPAPGAALRVNDDSCPPSGWILRSGDRIQAGTACLNYHTIREPEKPAAASLWLAHVTKALVVLFLLAQFWVLFLLPGQIKNHQLWERAADKQRIGGLLDQLRHDVRRLETADAGQEALQDALLAELNARANYLRQHEDRMSRSQRRAMLADLRQLQGLAERLQSGQVITPLPPLEIDQAIEAISGKTP